MSTSMSVLLPAMMLIVTVLASTAGMAATVGSQAPDFQFQSLINGQDIRLSDNFDKPTVLVFWVSWCSHCRAELPVIQNLYDQYGPTKANFVGVSLDARPEDAVKIVEDKSITFPNVFADAKSDTRVVSDYQIRGVPAIFVIDKGGTIRARHEGAVNEQVLREDLSILGVE